MYSADGSDQITFAGEMADDTGLVRLFARHYDPAIGRFYALDPELEYFSSPQSMSRFVYRYNSPIVYKDPTGKFGIIEALIGMAIFDGLASINEYKC